MVNLKTLRSSISELTNADALRIILDIRQSRRVRKVRTPTKTLVKTGTAPLNIDKLEAEQIDLLIEALSKITEGRNK